MTHFCLWGLNVQKPREAHKNLLQLVWFKSDPPPEANTPSCFLKLDVNRFSPWTFKNKQLVIIKACTFINKYRYRRCSSKAQTSDASKQAEKWQTDFTGWSVLRLNFNSLKCKVVSKQTVVWNWNQTGALCGGALKQQLLPQSIVKKNKRLFTSNRQCSLKPKFINKMFFLLWLCFVLLLEDCC